MSLREITKELHHEAETTKAAKALLSGKISKEDYRKYIYQLLLIYGPIEVGNRMLGNLKTLPGVERLPGLYTDYMELKDEDSIDLWLPSTLEYHTYLINLLNDPTRKHLIKAHMYCRHKGDLHGGQIIAKQVSSFSQGRFYQFADKEALKIAIRAELTDDLGDEACVAFRFAINMLKELGGE